MHPLGQWAVLDIETTGLNPAEEAIIDVGFLRFEGLELKEKYSSLVRYDGKLSEFIKKLTGINEKELKQAPPWLEVEPVVQSLAGHTLVAHNSGFEESFLKKYFEPLERMGGDDESFVDSLDLLSLLEPGRDSYSLETFIVDYALADKEMHRGLQDSLDLLKVMLVAMERCTDLAFLQGLFSKHYLQDHWFSHFLNLDQEERDQLAQSIDFSPTELEASVPQEQVLLEPVASEFSGENVQEIFQNTERVQKVFPHYTYRNEQEKLALRVGQSFKNEVHALIQAPTGTGKTLGYLVPAALYAKHEKKQVLIATGTRALQHQAFHQDLPKLRKILGLDETELKAIKLVGSKNHLCELLYQNESSESSLFDQNAPYAEKFEKVYFDWFFYQNEKRDYAQKLLAEDVPYHFQRNYKNFEKDLVSWRVDFRACSGKKCPYAKHCSYLTGLREAKEAHFIIGNHALMFQWPKGFPRPLHIIVDEAHRIEGEATSSFALEVTEKNLQILLKSLQNLQGIGGLFYLLSQEDEPDAISDIRQEVSDGAKILEEHLGGFHELLQEHFAKTPRYTSLFWNELPMIKEGKKSEEVAIRNRVESIRFIFHSLVERLVPYLNRWDVKFLEDDSKVIAYTRFESFLSQLTDIDDALTTLLEGKEEYSHSLKFHERDGFSLLSAPIDVGDKVYRGLLLGSSSVIFTSATLANAHGNFGTMGVEWLTGYTYLANEKRFKSGLYLPSFYKYDEKSKIFLCPDTPALYDSSFVESTLKEIIPIIKKIGGKSLLLFSARKRFELAREILLKEDFPVFVQGMGKNIVEAYRKSSQGVLLGMESFGEGIDLPGDLLQFVFIDKIPDIRQEQVIKKRQEYFDKHFGNSFLDYFLASRARSLHQKLGRLLRTENDFGGAIIVDSRIKRWRSKTKEDFFRLMEPYKIETTDLKQASKGIHEFISQNS